MPDSIGTLVRRAALAACLGVLIAVPAAAQPPLAEPPVTAQFMSRYDFQMSAAKLAADDDRFQWDTIWGGNFDLVDYVHGRMFFLADYQAVLGKEFRPFDPYQSNYTLEAAGSARLGRTELVGVLHHVSRHLGDRPKRAAIAWNELDLRVLRQFAGGGATIDLRAEAGTVIARAAVDYSWTSVLDLTVRRPLTPSVGVFGHGSGRLVGVIETSARDQQWGGRAEAGFRFTGQAGALELFGGVERVIDADPIAGLAREWAFAGFRLVTK